MVLPEFPGRKQVRLFPPLKKVLFSHGHGLVCLVSYPWLSSGVKLTLHQISETRSTRVIGRIEGVCLSKHGLSEGIYKKPKNSFSFRSSPL